MNSRLSRYSGMKIGECKGKFHPRTGREDPEGEKKCHRTHSLTSALCRAGCQCHVPVRLTPGQENHYAMYKKAGWALGPVWTGAVYLWKLIHNTNVRKL